MLRGGVTMPKRKPNPNQKVMRVHAKTADEIKLIALYRGVTPPDLIDEMLAIFKENITALKKKGDGNEPSNN
jgi:hypothetical protein